MSITPIASSQHPATSSWFSTLFRKTSIGVRILVLVLVPMMALVGNAGVIVQGKWAVKSDMTRLTEVADVAAKISAAIHELQKERGVSAVYLGSKGTALADKVPEQRALTDSKLGDLNVALGSFDAEAYSARLADAISAANRAISELGGMRSQISALSVSAQDSNKYFGDTIARLISAVAEIASIANQADVASAISNYVLFIQAKERAGQERASGAPGFAAGVFDAAQFNRFSAALTEQQTFLALFKQNATEEQKRYFDMTVTGEPVSEVERMRKLAFDTGPRARLDGADGAHWYEMTTARINQLKTVEDKLAADMLAVAAQVKNAASSSFIVALAAGVGALAVSMLLAFIVARSITRSLRGMTDTMSRLAAEEYDIVVPDLDLQNEIGIMARALAHFRDTGLEARRLRAAQQAEQ
jgi:HAMP domain-containing protein